MIGGWTTTPESTSTGPGTDRPMPQTRAGSVPCSASSAANHRASRSSTVSGPSPTSIGPEVRASTFPARSSRPAVACRVPRSAARTTACPASNSSRVEGRPPVEPGSGAGSPSRSQPAAKSWSSRWPTVDLDSPVTCCRAPRVVARPSRMSRSRWPALDWLPVVPVMLSSALVRSRPRAPVRGQRRPAAGAAGRRGRCGYHRILPSAPLSGPGAVRRPAGCGRGPSVPSGCRARCGPPCPDRRLGPEPAPTVRRPRRRGARRRSRRFRGPRHLVPTASDTSHRQLCLFTRRNCEVSSTKFMKPGSRTVAARRKRERAQEPGHGHMPCGRRTREREGRNMVSTACRERPLPDGEEALPDGRRTSGADAPRRAVPPVPAGWRGDPSAAVHRCRPRRRACPCRRPAATPRTAPLRPPGTARQPERHLHRALPRAVSAPVELGLGVHRHRAAPPLPGTGAAGVGDAAVRAVG